MLSRSTARERDRDEDPRGGFGQDAARVPGLRARCVLRKKEEQKPVVISTSNRERQDDAPVEYHHTVNDPHPRGKWKCCAAPNGDCRRQRDFVSRAVNRAGACAVRGTRHLDPQTLSVPDARPPFMRLFDDARNRSGDCGYLSGCAGIIKTRRRSVWKGQRGDRRTDADK